MLKLVIDDYRMDFIHMIKNKKGVLDWVGTVYLSVMLSLPLASRGGRLLLKPRCLIWCIFLWMVIWMCLYLADLYPNETGKMFDLLPTSEEDRKNYMLTGYWFRVLFLTMIVALVVLVGMIFMDMPFLQAGPTMIHFFLMMCMRNTHLTEEVLAAGTDAGKRHLYYLEIIGCIACVLLIFLSTTAWLRQCTWEYSRTVTEEFGFTGSAAIEAILFTVEVVLASAVCVIYWRNRMEERAR